MTAIQARERIATALLDDAAIGVALGAPVRYRAVD